MSLAASFFAPAPRASHYGATQSMGSDGWLASMLAPRTAAGVQVNEQVAMESVAVFAAVSIIADAVAQLPLDVVRKEGDKRTQEPGHPVAQLLEAPCPAIVGNFTLRNVLQSHTLLWGNSYCEIQRSQGGKRVEALWPLLPDRTTPRRVNGVVTYSTNIDGKVFEFHPNDVLHIAGLGFDGLLGYSPIRMAKNAIGLGLALEAFGSRFFSNDAKSGGFLSHPSKLSPDAHKRLVESMQAQGGLENAHRMKVLEEGMTYHANTIAPEDSQFLASRTFSVEEIARLYRVPLHLLQSQSKTTSWGSGIAQMTLGFLQHTLAPWLARWEQALGARLFTEDERRAGYSIRHNVNALLRADPVQRAQFYTAALNPSTGWMSRNEVRALEDLNPDDVENAATMTTQPPAFTPQDEPPERPEPEENDE